MTEATDTRTPAGCLQFHIFGALAEFEAETSASALGLVWFGPSSVVARRCVPPEEVWMLSRASKSTKLRGSVDGLDRLDTLDVVTGVVTPGPHRPYGRMSAAGQISANVSHSGPETSNESAPTLASRSALVCQAARRPGTPVHRWVRSASHRFSRCPAAEAAGGSCLAPGASLPVAPRRSTAVRPR